jgi:hypothetical protein
MNMQGTKIAYRFIVRADCTLDELKNEGVVAGNFRVHKLNPLVNQSRIPSFLTEQGGVGVLRSN